MDPKVPNKLASIFVTGGLTIVLIAFFYGDGFIRGMYHLGELERPTSKETASEKETTIERETGMGKGPEAVTETVTVTGKETTTGQGGSSHYVVLNSARFLVMITGLVTFAGAIIQGAGHLFRLFLQHFFPSQRFCAALLNGPARREIERWNKTYVNLSKDTFEGDLPKSDLVLYDLESEFRQNPKQIPDVKAPFPDTAHPIVPRQSVSIFFRYAKGAHLAWVLQHYATYYLTTDIFAALFLAGLIGPLVSGGCIFYPTALSDLVSASVWWHMALWYLALLVSVYFLTVVSAHRYLYTYNAVIRHCCATMSRANRNFPSVGADSQ